MNRAAGFLRSQIAARIRARSVPVLRFRNDDSQQRGEAMDALINEAVGSGRSPEDGEEATPMSQLPHRPPPSKTIRHSSARPLSAPGRSRRRPIRAEAPPSDRAPVSSARPAARDRQPGARARDGVDQRRPQPPPGDAGRPRRTRRARRGRGRRARRGAAAAQRARGPEAFLHAALPRHPARRRRSLTGRAGAARAAPARRDGDDRRQRRGAPRCGAPS